MTRTTLLAASAAAALFAVPAAQHQHHQPTPAPTASLVPAPSTHADHGAMGHGSTTIDIAMMTGMGGTNCLTGSGTARLPYKEVPMRARCSMRATGC